MSTPALLHPVDYTSRDYLALREDLINVIKSRIPEWQADDPADFGVALVEMTAYAVDVMNYYIDRSAAETFLGTASQRSSLLQMANLLGYSPAGRVAAEVPLTFTNLGPSSVTIPAGAQVATVLREGDVNRRLVFEVSANNSSSDGSWSVAGGGQSLTITASHGETQTDVLLGQSTGYPNQTFSIRDTPLVNRSLDISVGATPGAALSYTYVQNLYEATPTDTMFTYRTDADGVTTVMFGDGVSGVIPPLAQNVYATYRLGGGVVGNIAHGMSFTPVNFSFTGSIVNQVRASGGADEESNEQIRRAAFTAFRTRNSAVTKTDFEDLALSDNRISKAKGRGNSVGNMLVYVAPTSSGDQKTDPQPGYDAYNVISRSITSNVVTLTLSETPQFSTTIPVTVSGMGAPWDGSYTATPGANNTITYPKVNANVLTESCTGVVATAELDEFAQVRADVQKSLLDRGVIGTLVRVFPPRYRDIKLAVDIGIKPQFRQSVAVAAVRSALRDVFAYNAVPFNLTVRPQDVLANLTNTVQEIRYATVTLYTGPGGTTTTEVTGASDEIIRLLDGNLTVTVNAADPGIANA